MNHYEILGVSNTATADEIKKAYRKLASAHHPDKEGGDTKKFQEIQAAYAILSEPQKRAQYDEELAGGGRPQHFSFHTGNMGGRGGMPGDIEEMLRSFMQNGGGDGDFGGNPFNPFARRPPPRQQKNQDVRINYQIDLVDTLSEQVKMLDLRIPGLPGEQIELKIPRGVFHGAVIKYPELGGKAIKELPRGDLHVQFHVKPHPDFDFDGMTLITQLTIDALEAIIGCEKEITGLDGKVFSLTIPPGTQFGTRFGIKDQGLYHTNMPGRGKLIVMLKIEVPTNLTEDQIKTIRDLLVTR